MRAQMTKTKMVDGKELTAADFAYVGNPDDPETWKLPIHDEDHARNALARFNQADIPTDEKPKVARKLLAAAKKFGVDASGFGDEYAPKAKEGARLLADFGDYQVELENDSLY